MDHSSFARLAPELRNNIYEHALAQTKPFILSFDSPYHGLRICNDGATTKNPLALAKACSGTHAEAIRMFYAINTFIFRVPNNNSAYAIYALKEFYSEIGAANVAALRSIVVDIGKFSSADLVNPAFKKTLLEVVNVLRGETKRQPTCHFRVKLTLSGLSAGDVVDAEIDMRRPDASMSALTMAIEKHFKIWKHGTILRS